MGSQLRLNAASREQTTQTRGDRSGAANTAYVRLTSGVSSGITVTAEGLPGNQRGLYYTEMCMESYARMTLVDVHWMRHTSRDARTWPGLNKALCPLECVQ